MAITRILSLAFQAAALVVTASAASAQELRPWMPSEIGQAWSLGYEGQKTSITVIDDFRSSYGIQGNLRGQTELLRHGEWTALEAGMMAPSAKVHTQDFTNTKAVKLRKGLNTLNLSYGMIGPEGYSSIRWSAREASIIKYAGDGKAVVVKAAGNDGIAVGATNAAGEVDYLNRDLIGKKSAIFVGALSAHGTVGRPASLAWYSNTAGSDPTAQNQFLVVGVTGDKTGLYGTSFAAPIVSGYAAVLGSKFKKANATQITNQLLNTARTDTIQGYSVDLHGRGEANISRALAPVKIK